MEWVDDSLVQSGSICWVKGCRWKKMEMSVWIYFSILRSHLMMMILVKWSWVF